MVRFEAELLAQGAVATTEYGVVYVERPSWHLAVDAAERLGLVILGIEGLARDDGDPEAMLDHIADFSDFGPSDGPASWAAARRVLEMWSTTNGPDAVEFEFL